MLLEAGDRVPADGRIVVAVNLEIDESSLTGESQPAGKHAQALPAGDVSLADRSNLAHMNTLVTRGRAEVIVTATGVHTEMGQLSRQLADAREPPSPLQVQLDALGKRLGLVAVSLVAILFVLQLVRGEPLSRAVLDSIALAVAAMPEGLPAVVTVTLALGMHKLSRQRAIVKRLASVETLGCTTVICSDKTGTLTVNRMTVRAAFLADQHLEATGEGYTLRAKSVGPTAPLPPSCSTNCSLRSCCATTAASTRGAPSAIRPRQHSWPLPPRPACTRMRWR